jgi:hypothetical protein
LFTYIPCENISLFNKSLVLDSYDMMTWSDGVNCPSQDEEDEAEAEGPEGPEGQDGEEGGARDGQGFCRFS